MSSFFEVLWRRIRNFVASSVLSSYERKCQFIKNDRRLSRRVASLVSGKDNTLLLTDPETSSG